MHRHWILYGKCLSPYVRRVAVSLNFLNLAYERVVISAIQDEQVREKLNPVGRVPALKLSEDDVLIDSHAILDYVDEHAGDLARLLPRAGLARKTALRRLALATGAIDRAMTANAERRRPDFDAQRLTRLIRQCKQGFGYLENELGNRELFDTDRGLQQVDITTVVGFSFINHIFPGTLRDSEFPGLNNLAIQCEERDCFKSAEID